MIKSNLLDDFISYLSTSRGTSEKTNREYYYDIRTFFRFILIRKSIVKEFEIETEKDVDIDLMDLDVIKSIDKRDVYAYISYLDKNRKNNNKTKFRKISSVRTFFNYLANKVDLIEYNPAKDVDMPKIEKTLPTYLTLDESYRLLKEIENSKSQDKYKARDFAIITIFLNCGVRLSELTGLDINDIRDNDTMVVTGKGSKQRSIYLNRATKEAINNYLLYRPKSKDEALFLSNRNTRISNRQVQRMVEKYITNAGLDPNKYTVHKLRHTAATLMYQYGDADIRSLQEILGHESVTTTQIYTHIDNKSLRETVENNPLSDYEFKEK
ncbi:tyrosine recombinase XerC [Peptoniphilus catoniae]|uniref:tyrosine recombinase XerC n=1 Tax=Peptoniphilus catoniae TaxID=1660341 RepID=UPI0010FE4A8E|nr:tyrosine recombinase XerC [Peptoniphilus catoniae]